MNIIQGNLLDVDHGIICHQVNCKHVMGAGLAAQIRRKYPRHYGDYVSRIPHLGGLCITQIDSDLYVVGIYGQDGYGRDKQYTQYPALKKGLAAVAKLGKEYSLPVYLPYGIGCGLAGGDWSIVSKIIERVVPEAIVVRKE